MAHAISQQHPHHPLVAMLVLVASSGSWANPVAGCRLAATGPRIPVEVQTWCDTEAFTCASAYIKWSGEMDRFSQTITVRNIGKETYFPLAWDGGYIGVQTDGNSVTGVVGPTAVFSLGGAGVQIRPLPSGLPNPNCEGGFDGAAGASCRVALTRPIRAGDNYVYSVRKLPGGWFRGQIKLPGGRSLGIADLKPGPGSPTNLSSLYNFVEYFGPIVASLDLVPRSVIEFHHYWPAVRTTVARLQGVCATAVDNGTGGAIVRFGGACD